MKRRVCWAVMKIARLLLLIALLSSDSALAQQAKQWLGFPRVDHVVDGVKVTLVSPLHMRPSDNWIWRARFFGHEPQTDRALLARGFHLAYVDVAGLFGNDEAMRRWDKAYEFLTREKKLGSKPVLEAMSRGGLIALRWAAANPHRVSCIYLDAPVCDINSWPGGRGTGKGHAATWQQCLKAWDLSEESASQWKGSLTNLQRLANASVPILSICGDADDVVPMAENTTRLANAYRKAGGWIRVIAKKGVGHHPHSLEDPEPIVQFILRHTRGSGDWFKVRGGGGTGQFDGFEKRARVVFLGGSITYNPGWRDLVSESLRRRFPKTRFTFVNAGIPSFGSVPGAYRFRDDVLSEGKTDILFVEAAVNDSTNGRTYEQAIRGMEGIVRQAIMANEATMIVMLHFVDPPKMKMLNSGHIPEVIRAHEKVADVYGIASIDLATEVTERIAAGEFSWEKDFKNLHPSPFGQRLYAASIDRLFDRIWHHGNPNKIFDSPEGCPSRIDDHCYDGGRHIPPVESTARRGFRLIGKWRPTDGAGTRAGFVNVPVLEATDPGSSLEFEFKGRAVGIQINAGPDAGRIEYSVDGAEWQQRELFTRWSGGLHLPWTVILEDELESGDHKLKLRIADSRHPRSRGHAVRIVHFLVNE